MKKIVISAAATALLNLVAVPLYAADTHASHHTGAEAQKNYAVKGEIVTVDKEAGKANIRHEAVSELGWPGMTMIFPAANKKLLRDLKPGDKIDFTIAKNPENGQYTIQTLQPAK